jgi:hypothetical protein
MKTAHERQQEQKQAKLEQMQEQIDAGTLVIRKMTEEERAKYPPKQAQKPRRSYRVR